MEINLSIFFSFLDFLDFHLNIQDILILTSLFIILLMENNNNQFNNATQQGGSDAGSYWNFNPENSRKALILILLAALIAFFGFSFYLYSDISLALEILEQIRRIHNLNLDLVSLNQNTALDFKSNSEYIFQVFQIESRRLGSLQRLLNALTEASARNSFRQGIINFILNRFTSTTNIPDIQSAWAWYYTMFLQNPRNV